MSAKERAAAVQAVLEATQAHPDTVKQAAVDVLATTEADEVTETANAVMSVVEATKTESPAVTAAAVTAVGSQGVEAVIPPPPPDNVSGLWKALVWGLVGLLFVTLGGLLWAILDGDNSTSADKVLIVFTPLLTGLLGLFTPSPRQRSETGAGQPT